MHIFLSYGHDQNAELVERIQKDLVNAGHTAWIDKEGIKFGDHWRRSISDGIEKSERVLAFISKHSVRDPGVCLDELGIALGIKYGNMIAPILLEPLEDSEIPSSISHIQRLDMRDWKNLRDNDELAFEDWYKEQLAEILRALGANAHFTGEIQTLADKLKPMNTASAIGRLLRHNFVGRDWLLEDIETWREKERDKRVYCLTADPGFGKSTFAAWLVHKNKVPVVAAHFCHDDQPNWSTPSAVIRSIAFQMATHLPDYRRRLLASIEGRSDPQFLDSLSPAELFEFLITNPVRSTIDGGRERCLVVIDALDETDGKLIRYLAEHKDSLPRWLALFITSRPRDHGVQQLLSQLNVQHASLSDPRNQTDTKNWIQNWFENELKLSASKQARLIEPLLKASEANFHYLSTFRQMVKDSKTDVDADALLHRPETYPSGLTGLYLRFFERQFGSGKAELADYRKFQRPLLRLIMAARSPLPLVVLQDALRGDPIGAEPEDFVTLGLQPLGSLFPREGQGAQQTIRPFHKSVRDWLTDHNTAGSYYVDPASGHLKLGHFLWQQLEDKGQQATLATLSPYAVAELPYHILAWTPEERESLRSTSKTTVLAANSIAEELKKAVRWREAENWLRLVLKLSEEWLGLKDSQVVNPLTKLALFLQSQLMDWDEVEELLSRALTISREEYGAKNTQTAIALDNLAIVYKVQGKLDAAESLFREALDIQQNTPGSKPVHIMLSLHHLAEFLQTERNWVSARPLLRDALMVAIPNVWPLNHDMRWDDASTERFFKRVLLTIWTLLDADLLPVMPAILNTLAVNYMMEGDNASAERFLKPALRIQRQVSGAEHQSSLAVEHSLGRLYIKLKLFTCAENCLGHVLRIQRRDLGDEHWHTVMTIHSIAYLLKAQRKFDKAEEYFEYVLNFQQWSGFVEDLDTAIIFKDLAECCQQQGKLISTEDFFNKELAILKRLREAEHRDIVICRNNLENLRASMQKSTSEQQRRSLPKVGRNEPCSCGSGKKYKKCCGA